MKKLLLSLSLISLTAQAMEYDELKSNKDLEAQDSQINQALLWRKADCKLSDLLKHNSFENWEQNEGQHISMLLSERNTLQSLFDVLKENKNGTKDCYFNPNNPEKTIIIPLKNMSQEELDIFKEKLKEYSLKSNKLEIMPETQAYKTMAYETIRMCRKRIIMGDLSLMFANITLISLVWNFYFGLGLLQSE